MIFQLSGNQYLQCKKDCSKRSTEKSGKSGSHTSDQEHLPAVFDINSFIDQTPNVIGNSSPDLYGNAFSSCTSAEQMRCPGSDHGKRHHADRKFGVFTKADVKDHLHTIGDRFAKLVIDEPDEDAAKRQEPDQIPEVFRPDSGTGIKSQPESGIDDPDENTDDYSGDRQNKSVFIVFVNVFEQSFNHNNPQR